MIRSRPAAGFAVDLFLCAIWRWSPGHLPLACCLGSFRRGGSWLRRSPSVATSRTACQGLYRDLECVEGLLVGAIANGDDNRVGFVLVKTCGHFPGDLAL